MRPPIAKVDRRYVRVTVCDCGRGLPATIEAADPEAAGLQLVAALADTVDFDPDRGRFTFEICP
jgi:hypothetical protein